MGKLTDQQEIELDRIAAVNPRAKVVAWLLNGPVVEIKGNMVLITDDGTPRRVLLG